MKRLTGLAGAAVILIACSSPDSATSTSAVELTTTTGIATTTSDAPPPSTATTTSTPTLPTTAETPSPTTNAPDAIDPSWEMFAQLPADTIATGIARSPAEMVVIGWHEKDPGVSAARSMILVGSDGRQWTEIDLADLVGPEDTVHLTGIVWTGTEYLVTTDGASLGDSGVVWRSGDGRSWTRSILEPPQPEDAAVGRAAALIGRRLTPELIQVDGDVGLTGIRRVGDSLVVVGWTRRPAIRAVVWQSRDAASWTSRFLPGDGEIAFGLETHAGTTVVHGGGTGGGGGSYSVAWVGDDPADWRRVEYDIPDLEFVTGEAVGPGGRLVRVTSHSESGGTWWASTDGASWSDTRARFDAVGVSGNEWIGITCSGRTGEAAVASAPDVWEPAGDVEFCPRSVVHDGDETLFQTAYGVLWRRSIPVWTTGDLPLTGASDVAVVNVAADDTLNVRSGPGSVTPFSGGLHRQRVGSRSPARSRSSARRGGCRS